MPSRSQSLPSLSRKNGSVQNSSEPSRPSSRARRPSPGPMASPGAVSSSSTPGRPPRPPKLLEQAGGGGRRSLGQLKLTPLEASPRIDRARSKEPALRSLAARKSRESSQGLSEHEADDDDEWDEEEDDEDVDEESERKPDTEEEEEEEEEGASDDEEVEGVTAPSVSALGVDEIDEKAAPRASALGVDEVDEKDGDKLVTQRPIEHETVGPAIHEPHSNTSLPTDVCATDSETAFVPAQDCSTDRDACRTSSNDSVRDVPQEPSCPRVARASPKVRKTHPSPQPRTPQETPISQRRPRSRERLHADAVEDDGDMRPDGVSPSKSVLSVKTPVGAQNSTMPGASQPKPVEVTAEAAGKVKRKFKGIKQTKALTFDSVHEAVRAALAVGNHVWTVDWRGNIAVRDRTKVERVVHTIPSSGLIWCLCAAAPGIVLAGTDGTPAVHVLDASTKELLGMLSGHVGGVTCLVYEGRSVEEEASENTGCKESAGMQFMGRFWSGSNDFTIGCWEIHLIVQGKKKAKGKADKAQSKGKAGAVAACGPGEVRLTPAAAMGQEVSIRRTATLHEHTGSVKCLLRIGPVLWSGGAEGHLHLWRISSNSLVASVRDATDKDASVLNLALVRGRVWSCSADGCVREWSIGGLQAPPRCLRVMRLGGGEAGGADCCPRSCIPIGGHVWLAGHNPDISVYDGNFTKLAALPAHDKYISSMLIVDRVETRVVWSTSLGDKKLKVWRHELRGDECADAAELQAANSCYAEECAALERAAQEWQQCREEQAQQIRDLEAALAEEQQRRQDTENQLAELLEAERRRREAVECHLGEERRKRGETDDALKEECLRRGKLEGEIEDLLRRFRDMEEELKKERRFRERLEGQLAEECRLRGEGDEALKAESDGRRRLQAEADTLLNRLARLEEELNKERRFRDGLEGQLSEERRLRGEGDAALKAETDGRIRLQGEADMLLGRLARLEEELRTCRDSLAAEVIKRQEAEAAREQAAAEAAAAKAEMEAREAERLRALEACEQMRLRYAQLDVFKLDVIARELKKTDQGLESLRRRAKDVAEALKGRHGGEAEREKALNEALGLVQHGGDMRAHVRDIIERCLSETQKLHIGAAVVDGMAAGELQDGGVLGGWVDAKKSPKPSAAADLGSAQAPHGSSRAARLRQGDELRREADLRAPTPPPAARLRSPSLQPPATSP